MPAGVKGVLDALPSAVVVTDRHGCITFITAAAQQLFGYNPTELLGRSVQILVPPSRSEHAPDVDTTVFDGPAGWSPGHDLTLIARHRDGHEVPVDVFLAPLETVEGTWVVATITDGTERRERTQAAARTARRAHLVTVRDDDQARIAEQLYAHTLQDLAALDLRLTLLERNTRATAPELADSTAGLRPLLAHAATGLRQLVHELRPADAGCGLADSVRAEATYVFTGTATTWTLEAGVGAELPDVTRAHAVRIVRDVLLTVRAQPAAGTVDITLSRVADGVEIVIVDDRFGREFDAVTSRRWLATIDTMRERAEAVGGWWSAERGAVIRFWLPDATS